MSLTKRQIATLKDQILADKERVVNSMTINNDEKSVLAGEGQSDEIDQASSDYDRSQALRFRNRNAFYAKKLDKALLKLDAGEYGACEECDEDIKYVRLTARPTAQLCIQCKDEAEREENNNFLARQSKSLEKPVVAL